MNEHDYLQSLSEESRQRLFPVQPLTDSGDWVFDLHVRIRMHGKRSKLRSQLARTVRRELELQFNHAELVGISNGRREGERELTQRDLTRVDP